MGEDNIQDKLDEIQEDTTSMEEKLETVNKISEGTKKKLRNLQPFKKGPDPRRNLEGRPEGSVSIVEGIKRKLMEIQPENKKTYLELFLNKLFLKAIKEGDVTLMKDIINRVDGMPKQSIDATTNGQNLSTISMSDFIALIQVNDESTTAEKNTSAEPDKLDSGSV